jgi:uncharacterized protein YndB with AHSA1/START domain
MKSFAATISIQASAERVWAILTDLARWPQWNSTVDRVSGDVALGNRVTVWVKISPARAFPVRVTEFAPPQRMVWAGGMPLGLFVGTRTYELATAGPLSTVFRMSEQYAGPLASLIVKSIPDLQPAFDEFAQCLKREAERS